MPYWKTALIKFVTLASALTTTFTYSADLCECGFLLGADYLYWSPCVSNLHFAAEGTNPLSNPDNHVKYHFIHDDWDSGYRIYAGKEDFLGCFDLLFTFTSFDSKNHGHTFIEDAGELSLSWPTPFQVPYGNQAAGEWKLDFERYQLTAQYSIEFGKGCCLRLSPHAGVDYASICQNKKDEMKRLIPSEVENAEDILLNTTTMEHSLDYNGIGPLVGMGYSFEFCEGLSTFGNASVSVLVGEADIKGHLQNIDSSDEEEIETNNHQKYRDDCVCVPGIHLQMGLSYEGCICNINVLFRAGYEYLQWMHAPSSIMYNQEIPGTITGLNHNSITMQGFFGGISLSF